jgi:hypothetical protein
MGAELREMRRALADAGDERMLQVLRYVDALSDRGRADGLVAPLRQRLRQLRPARPLRFARLLFAPMDPVIVDAAAWRSGTPCLSRSMILPLSALVSRALPHETAAAEAIGIALDLSAVERVCAAGAVLWQPAAAVLRTAAEPPEWRSNALPPALFPPMAAAVAVCLDMVHRLDALADPTMQNGEREFGLADVLRAAEQVGPLAWGMQLTIVLQRFPLAEAAHKASRRADAVLRGAAVSAQTAAWGWIEAAADDLSFAEPAEAATDLHRQICWLEVMAGEAGHRKQAAALQTRLRAACATGFQAALTDRVIAPMRQLLPATMADAGTLDMLEADLRGLRCIDVEIRRLGGGAAQDKMLRDAAAAVAARPDLDAMDRLRLLELLLGSQAALQMARAASTAR